MGIFGKIRTNNDGQKYSDQILRNGFFVSKSLDAGDAGRGIVPLNRKTRARHQHELTVPIVFSHL
jgi:hypothetical protein